MKTGVIFPSYAQEVTYGGGAWLENYPVSNLKNLVEPSRRTVQTVKANVGLFGTFPQDRVVQAVAIIGHKAIPADPQFQVLFYSGVEGGGSIVGNSHPVSWWPSGSAPVPGYRSIRPVILPAPVTARSFQVYMNEGSVAHSIEAIEVGGFWEWPGISYGRQIGFRPDDGVVSAAGGASFSVSTARKPRYVNGQIEAMKLADSTTKGLDFQKLNDIQRPFVWAEDFDDPATWPRKCMLVRNEELPPLVGSLYKRDRFPIRLIEHMR